jgi:large subunit ribosomal protein L32
MQSAIQEELGLSPVEQEVVVLYEGEKVEQPAEYWKVNKEA